jgi:hypothetical protein
MSVSLPARLTPPAPLGQHADDARHLAAEIALALDPGRLRNPCFQCDRQLQARFTAESLDMIQFS